MGMIERLLKPRLAPLLRAFNARSRPSGSVNAARLRERGEKLETIVFRDAVPDDINALAELHVTTWNATYRTSKGPTVATRAWQWNEVFKKSNRRDFVLVLENRESRLIGFTWGRPHDGEFAGELSKIYLRWEYHGLGLGRRMMSETARRFLERNIHSFILFAELTNPTLGFYDKMGGERLLNDRGQFDGAYAWHDLSRLLLCAVAFVLSTACIANKRDSGASTVRDSAGVQIVENASPMRTTAPLAFDSTPVVDLGRVLDDPHQEFSGTVIPVRLSDGRLVVANGGSHEIRMFDANGTWLKSIGRDGEGPSEFRSLGWLHLGVGDTLRTYDWSLLRISVFAPDGSFQRATYLGAPGEFVGVRPVGVFDDGGIVTHTQNAVTVNAPAGVLRDTVAVLVHDGTGKLRDTIGHYPGSEAWVVRAENRMSVSGRPFGRDFFAATHGTQLIAGAADSPEIQVLDADGRLRRIVRWSAAMRPVTAADIAAFISRAGEGWEAGSEAKRQRYVETLKEAPYPQTMPAYAGVVVASDGSLWIRRYADSDRATFDVIDSTGTWQGAVQAPDRFTPSQILPDLAVGTWKAPDDVLHVRVYRLIRR